MTWRPDPSFYPSPRMAMKAPAEKFAYVAAFDPTRQKPDAIAVVDVDPGSKTYANILRNLEMPSCSKIEDQRRDAAQKEAANRRARLRPKCLRMPSA